MKNITFAVFIVLISIIVYFSYSKIFPLYKVKIGFPSKEKFSAYYPYPPVYSDYNSGEGSRDFYGEYDADMLNRDIIHDVLNAGVKPQPFITPRRWLREPITVYIKNVTCGQPSCWSSQAEVYLRPWLRLRDELSPLGIRFVALNDEEACDFPGTTTVFKVKCGKHGRHGSLSSNFPGAKYTTRPTGHMFSFFGPATVDAMRDWILDAVN